MISVEKTTRTVVLADHLVRYPETARARCHVENLARSESIAAIAGDCVSAFRLRAARLRLQAAIKEHG